MVHVLSESQIESLIHTSKEGSILIIGRVSWYRESDFAVNGWVHYNSRGLYTDNDVIEMVLKYQEKYVWWLH